MTLREEILNLTESKAEKIKLSSYKKIKNFDELFSDLFEKAVQKSGLGWIEFVEDCPEKYDAWKKKEIDPILKKNGKEAEDAFKEWQSNLYADI